MNDLKRRGRLINVGFERESERRAGQEWHGDRVSRAVFAAPTHRYLLCISPPERADVFRHYVYSLIFAYYLIVRG